MVRENLFKSKLASGQPCVSGWVQTADRLVAEVMAHAGFDALTFDLQHGVADHGDVVGLLQAASGTATIPLVRVRWNDPGQIMRALDMGAYGVICPMIDSAAEASAFVAACRYPPLGIRSFGPVRGLLYGGPDYAAHANDQIVTIAMIETRSALEHVDEIIHVPGLDALFVGPADLSQALGGRPGSDWTSGPVREALDVVLAACAARGMPAGIFTKDAAIAAAMLALGFAFVTVGSDLGYVTAGARQALEGLRALRDGEMALPAR